MPFDGTCLQQNSTCTIQSSSDAANVLGELKETYSSLATSVACRRVALTGEEQIVENNIVVADYLFYLPFGQTIHEDHRIVHNSITYLVNFVNDNPGGSSHHVEAQCLRTKLN